MTKITESQLLDKVSRLREYIAVVEAEKQRNEDAASIGQGIGNVIGGATGLAAAPARAVGDVASAAYNALPSWQSVKQNDL